MGRPCRDTLAHPIVTVLSPKAHDLRWRAAPWSTRQAGEPASCLVEHLEALAAGEPHEMATELGPDVEHLVGDRHHAATLPGRSRQNAMPSPAGSTGRMSTVVKYVPWGSYVIEPGGAQTSHEVVALDGQVGGELGVELVVEVEPDAMAGWNGPALTYVRNCLAVRAAVTSGSGPHSQPTFQPVVLNVLPPDEIVSVRSAMPGSVAIGTWHGSREDEVLVHLVGDDDQVVLDGQRRRSSPTRRCRTPCPSGCAAC